MIRTNGEREPVKSGLSAQFDDEDDESIFRLRKKDRISNADISFLLDRIVWLNTFLILNDILNNLTPEKT